MLQNHQATPMEDSRDIMIETGEKTRVIIVHMIVRAAAVIRETPAGGTKQIHGAVGREVRAMNLHLRKIEERVMLGLAAGIEEGREVEEWRIEMIANMLKTDEIMIELTEREENGMRKRGGKRKGKEEKKPRSLRKEEGRRKED